MKRCAPDPANMLAFIVAVEISPPVRKCCGDPAIGRAMNVTSAVCEYGFVRSAVYVGLGLHLTRTEEGRPFGMLTPGQA